MLDLWKAETLRFRSACLICAVLHVGVLLFYGRIIDPLQQPLLVYQVVAALYWLIGLSLGLYQIGGYRRPGSWLQLLHRPLAAPRIATALLAAGGCCLLLAIALPVLLMVCSQLAQSGRVVDLRHFQLPLAAGLTALVGYVSAAYLLLAPRRYSAMVVLFSLWLLVAPAGGPLYLLLQLLCLAVLFALLLTVFKPQHATLPRRIGPVLLTAAPLVLGVYLLLSFGLSMSWQTLWMMGGNHPLNGGARPGSYLHASRSESPTLIDAGLAVVQHSQAELWRTQLSLSETLSLRHEFDSRTPPGHMSNPQPLEFDDARLHVRHSFSQDQMRFTTRSLLDNTAQASLGIGEQQLPFAHVPLPISDTQMVAGNALYDYDSATRRISLRLQLADGESIVSAPTVHGDLVYVLSDQALYGFDALAFQHSAAMLQPQLRLGLPVPAAELDRIDLFDVLDGQIVSILRGQGSVDGPGRATQSMWLWTHADAGSSAIPLAERELKADFPQVFRYLRWWLSPALQQVRYLATQWPGGAQRVAREPVPEPATVRWLAAGAHLASLLLAFVFLRGGAMANRRRLSWLAACVVLGPSAVLALLLLHPEYVRWRRPVGTRRHALAAQDVQRA